MIVVGTAGHIDHGKTTLIQRLTGIDTDRLKEEKQRGISIELGFAYLDVSSEFRVGLIDVPGHERFVHHMIAGATGVDLVVLVVAADEGVMPQTREHVAICQLLGMTRGIVVITKADLVDSEWLELVRDDVQDYLADTFLAGAPMLDFAATWEGEQLTSFQAQLYHEIERLAGQVEKGALKRPFMMPVDRAFTVKGFGTVVTGTVQSGVLQVGDPVRLLPGNRRTKVRRLENHGQEARESRAGTRTAVNLPDIQKDEVQRGNVLVKDDAVEPVDQVTGKLRTVASLGQELKPQFKALFHTGSSLAEASVRVLEGRPVTGADEVLVGIRLAVPVALLPGDHFVLRGFAALADYGKTLGGGIVLWPRGAKARPENLLALHALAGDDPANALLGMCRLAGLAGISVAELPYLSPLPVADLRQAAAEHDDLVSVAVGSQEHLYHVEFFEKIAGLLADVVNNHHRDHPRQPGIKREELKSRLPAYLDREHIAAVVDKLVAEGRFKADEKHIARPDFEPRFDDRFKEQLRRLEEVLDQARFASPGREGLRQELDCDDALLNELLGHLSDSGTLVRITSDYYLTGRREAEARQLLVDYLRRHGTATTQQLKDLWSLTRKHLIPLAEYYDLARVTVRVGTSERKLREP